MHTFLNLNDYGETNKNLTFYHNVNLNRDIKLDNLRNKLNDLFKSQSFYGTISIKNNDLSNNLVIISPSFNGLNDISYNMVNQNVEIVDEAYYNYTYDNQYIIFITSSITHILNRRGWVKRTPRKPTIR